MRNVRKHELVIGLYPNTRGFAFAVFESPQSVVDWGLIEARGLRKNRQCLRRIAVLLGEFQPLAVVLQDAIIVRRARRIQGLHEAIVVMAETQGIQTHSYSRQETLRVFNIRGTVTKQSVAAAVAKLVPAFGNFIPPVRRIWESEHSRMALFDAAALALTFYGQAGSHSKNQDNSPPRPSCLSG